MLPLGNRVIDIGNAVVFGLLPVRQAVEIIQKDSYLASLSDDQLRHLIEATDDHWRSKLMAAILHPENVIIFPVLMVECAHTRMQAIGTFRQGASEEMKAEFEARWAHWMTLVARCLISKGMALLLPPDPGAALETFLKAYLAASALPDLDQPRLREAIGACCGQLIAANIGGWPEPYQTADAWLTKLMRYPNREQETSAYLKAAQAEFAPVREIFEKRQRFLRGELPPDQATMVDRDDVVIEYIDRVRRLGQQVLSDSFGMDEAKRLLLEQTDFSQVKANLILTLALVHLQSAANSPDVAAAYAELNYAAAHHLRIDEGNETRAFCALVLGAALATKAYREHQGADGFRHALPYLEEALSVFENEETGMGPWNTTMLLNQLAICYRGVGDLQKALATNHRTIQRLEAKGDDPVNLGTAYGNLADVQEQLGEVSAALHNHYKAFQLFSRARDLRLTKQALHYYSRLCFQLGRLDDLMAALEKTTGLMAELSDLEQAAQAYLQLGDFGFRTGQIEMALHAFQRVEDLLQPVLSKQNPEPRYLALYVDMLVWGGVISTMLLDSGSAQFDVHSIAQRLETARVISVELQDHNRLAKVWLQLAALYMHAGQFEEAESCAQMVEFIPCLPKYLAQHDEILGTLYVQQQRYTEAVEHLQQAAAVFDATQSDKKMATLYRLGQAFEGSKRPDEAAHAYESALDCFDRSRLGLYETSRIEVMAHAEEIYNCLIELYARNASNATRALFWLEKSKSRTFVETMGLSTIPLSDPPDAVRDYVMEEHQLLQKLNRIREELFISGAGASDRLGSQREMYACLEQLNTIWSEIAIHCPEYIELRRGSVIEWNDLQDLLEG